MNRPRFTKKKLSVFQDKTHRCARVRKNGNAELKSRAANEIKNVLAEVAKVAEVLPFLPFLPVQIFIKSGKSDLPGKEDRAALGRCKEWKTKEEEFAQLNEFPRFV